MMKVLFASFLTVITLSSSAFAQPKPDIAECFAIEATYATAEARAGALLRCVEALATDLIPRGVVMAFDRANGCPAGWVSFEAGNGRVIVGVDGGKYRLPYEEGKPKYLTGGSENHALTLDEMPKHRHYIASRKELTKDTLSGSNALSYRARRSSNSQNYTLYSAGPVEPSAGVTSYAGLNKPHNNMPPYVALYYCKKV